ncbi:HU domain-containing protein [Myroides injenensis]|uniref:HU domain-containing protein n=1 Tax=Myroides injenensis TaxID=1183151 RepID=UPI0002885E08|nr:SPOR domain-containing protein [Myroides injenensis]
MKIEKYISALLYRYQCVIVPGFGAFLTEIQSSFYDEETKTFFPPHKKLSFNVNIKHNDGLLANHIAKQENISYDEAVSSIKNELNNWNTIIKTIGNISIDGIGDFSANKEGHLVFTPSTNSNFLKTSFGLSSITSQKVARTPIIPLKEVKPIKSARRKTTVFVKYAATVASILAVGGILLKNSYEAYLDDQSLTIEKNVQTKVNDKIQQATFIIEPTATTIALPVKEQVDTPLPYHIIACAFRSAETAKQEAEKLQEKGFKNAVALDRTKYGMYPVAYSGYKDQAEAQKELRKIHRTLNGDAWILVK